MSADRCPVTAALEVIGGKWKPVILYQLRRGSLRFGEMRRAVPLATQKMLTQQLRELEKDGVIDRTVHNIVPPKVEYALSTYGTTLMPMLLEMCQWGKKHRARQERRSRAAKKSAPPKSGKPG